MGPAFFRCAPHVALEAAATAAGACYYSRAFSVLLGAAADQRLFANDGATGSCTPVVVSISRRQYCG